MSIEAASIANFSREFGWDVTVLTVNESHYEETLGPDLCKLVAPHVEVVKTEAWGVFELLGRRLIGDIGTVVGSISANACWRCSDRKIRDFVWIPIPSWYTLLLGRGGMENAGFRLASITSTPGCTNSPYTKTSSVVPVVRQTSGLDSRTHGDPESGADFGGFSRILRTCVAQKFQAEPSTRDH